MSVCDQLHRDASVRELKLQRLKLQSEKSLQRQLSPWRMTDSSKQWLRHHTGSCEYVFLCTGNFRFNVALGLTNDPIGSGDRLHNEHRLIQQRREEFVQVSCLQAKPDASTE